MATFYKPTKEEMDQILRAMANQTKKQIERWEDIALQFDRFTDAELVIIGYSDSGSPSEVDWIRSMCTAWKYTAKYYRKEDVSAYTDNPSYAIEHFSDIRNM